MYMYVQFDWIVINVLLVNVCTQSVKWKYMYIWKYMHDNTKVVINYVQFKVMHQALASIPQHTLHINEEK